MAKLFGMSKLLVEGRALRLIETGDDCTRWGEPKLPGQPLRMGKAHLPVFFNLFEINSQQTTGINIGCLTYRRAAARRRR